MKKVVLYLRYSSDKQTEQSIEGQERVCRQYCEQHKLQIVQIYIDRALSASKNIEKREGFMRMIRDSERGEWDSVVVYKLDRFSRNRYDSAIYKNKLRRNGVNVLSATENISTNPEGIILESVLEGMAEFYSKELAQKVTRGMNETALKGNSCGGTIPLGYRVENKKLVLDPIMAPIAKEAFERFANGEAIFSICADFNSRGIKTARGSKFNKNSFCSMFKNIKYIGTYKYKDIMIEGGIPAIVDKDTFEKVQIRLEENKRAPAKQKSKVEYLLSGKLICGHCGALMVGDSGTSHDGTVYHYYSCANRKKNGSCNKKPLKKLWIEDQVINDAIAQITPIRIEELADAAVRAADQELKENKIIPALQSSIKDTQNRINNLFKLVERGSESPSLFARLDELEEEKKNLEIRLLEEEKHVVKLDKNHVIYFLSQFLNGDPKDPSFRKKVADIMVNSITVWDEPDGDHKVTFLYNTISGTTKKVKGSDLALNESPAKNNPNLILLAGLVFGHTKRIRVER